MVVHLRAALILLILSTPVVSRAAHGRLSLSAMAGGGYASDVFVGADLGSGAMTQVIPSARLDLSLSPHWKLAAFADASLGYYVSSGFASLAGSTALEARFIPGATWDARLTLDADHARHSLGSPLDSSSGAGPQVFSTLGARASPLLRLRALGLEWRVAGVGATRTSTAADGDIAEQDLAALGGLMIPLGEDSSFALTYKLGLTESTRADFTFTSHAVFAMASWRLAEINWQAQLQLQTAKFATGTREDFGRLTFSGTYAIVRSVDLEATYSIAASQFDDASRPSASRHLAFLALRWRFLEMSW
jgi:hypothetical protein